MYRYLLLGFVFLACTTRVEAGFITFSPVNIPLSPHEIFEVHLIIDSEGEHPSSADSIINYDPDYLQIVNILPEPLDTTFFEKIYKKIGLNDIYIANYSNIDTPLKSGKGNLAVIRLQALQKGKTTLALQCIPGSHTDSNITLIDGGKFIDIIDCDKSKDLELTISDSLPRPTPRACINGKSGDYNCDGSISLADFEDWRIDYMNNNTTLKEFEKFREAFTK